jgi:hypothetical protein
MKTTNTKLVNETAATVAAHNEKHAALIELGMMEQWEQSEMAKRNEERNARIAKQEAAELSRFNPAKELVEKLNTEAAQAAGLVAERVSVERHYTNSGSFMRQGALDGVTVFLGGRNGRNYKFGKDGKLNTVSLTRMLEETYQQLAGEYKRKAEQLAKIEAAKELMPSGLLARVIAAAKMPFHEKCTPVLQSNGKIAVEYKYYPGRGQSPYTRQIFSPLTVAQWEKWVELKETHEAAIKALLEEAKA